MQQAMEASRVEIVKRSGVPTSPEGETPLLLFLAT